MHQLTPRIPRWSPVAVGVLVAAMVSIPVAVRAQDGASGARRWRIEPAVGVWHRSSGGPSTGRQVGQFVRLQVSRQRGAHVRLTASAGYHRLDDAIEDVVVNGSGQSRTDFYDAEIIAVTGGAARDLWQGRATAVSIGFEAGPSWSRDRHDRSIGSAMGAWPPTPGDWRLGFLGTPSLAVRHAVGPRVEFTATGRLLLGVGDFEPETVPTLGAGVAYRF
jgi:hypothetical protein